LRTPQKNFENPPLTLGDEKLTSLTILSIENKIAKRMDFSGINNFTKLKLIKVIIKV